eukprot:GILJ01004988.1.p1 GENE.GILJ01004988.1~~GILJ01004988.1.p1  ORF type:complete len:244 (-),score=24.69 GILJ01004988.1:139-768(-)
MDPRAQFSGLQTGHSGNQLPGLNSGYSFPMQTQLDAPLNALASMGIASNQIPISSRNAELELELSLRGNLLVQQQRRIVQLEDELQKAWDEIKTLRSQISDFDNERKTVEHTKKPQSRYWSPEEHQRFLEGLEKFGAKDVKAIANFVGSRSATQVRTHAQKYYLRMQKLGPGGKQDGKRDRDFLRDDDGSSSEGSSHSSAHTPDGRGDH